MAVKSNNDTVTYKYLADSTEVGGFAGALFDEWHVRDHLGSIRHRFSGKEEQRFGFDIFNNEYKTDHGLLDFGARYYDPFSCRWTTPDPLAEKYPAISPYAYCANNPVNLVDPEGKSDYHFNADGSYTVEENEDPYDRIIIANNTMIIANRSILGNIQTAKYRIRDLEDNIKNKTLVFTFIDSFNSDLFSLFTFLSDNTDVEWGLFSRDSKLLLGTTRDNDKIREDMLYEASKDKTDVLARDPDYKIHNHPAGYLSEIDSMTSDVNNMLRTPNTRSYVYFPTSSNYYRLTSRGAKRIYQKPMP